MFPTQAVNSMFSPEKYFDLYLVARLTDDYTLMLPPQRVQYLAGLSSCSDQRRFLA